MFKDVQELHNKFGITIHAKPTHLTERKLVERIDFMHEELNEFINGCAKQDLAEQADALIDLVYVAMGTAAMLGLPWEPLWQDVHRANLAKERGVGKRGHAVDLVKPEGWEPPQTMKILQSHGYDEAQRVKREDYYDDQV